MRSLPVQATLKHIFSSTIDNLGFALRAQWPWILITTVVFLVVGGIFPEMFSDDKALMEKTFADNPGKLGLFFLLMPGAMLITLLAFSSCAVAWHRYILLDEVPTGAAKLRVDGTVWRYAGNLILIGLVLFLAMIPALLFVALAGPTGFIGVVIYSVLVLAPILYRLSIKLPAVALERRDFKMSDAWRASEGNWWQIIGLGLALSALSWIAGLGLKLLSKLFAAVLGEAAGFWPDFVFQLGINWIITIIGITLLTSLYGFFVEKREF